MNGGLPMDFTPVAGDTAGNNLKWDSMKIEADMYLKTGNYSLLRDVHMLSGSLYGAGGK